MRHLTLAFLLAACLCGCGVENAITDPELLAGRAFWEPNHSGVRMFAGKAYFDGPGVIYQQVNFTQTGEYRISMDVVGQSGDPWFWFFGDIPGAVGPVPNGTHSHDFSMPILGPRLIGVGVSIHNRAAKGVIDAVRIERLGDLKP
mgnify:CR=1 FL=1